MTTRAATRVCRSPDEAITAAPRGGFTLLEVLAAVALTAVVVATALGFQMQLSSSVIIAADRTEQARHAVAILDRIARDLEAAVLLEKPPDLDPLEHPWIFLGESDLGLEGADRVKFVRGGYRSHGDEGHASDLVLVSYSLYEGEAGGYELRRRIFPRLPEALDRSFPEADDENAFLLAEGLAHFALYFYDETGAEVPDWDSSLLARSSQLPVSVRIEVAMLEGEVDDSADFDPEEATIYSRRVVLPMRPIEIALLLPKETEQPFEDDDDEDDEEDDAAMSVAECLDLAGLEIDPQLLEPAAEQAGMSVDEMLSTAVVDWPLTTVPIPEDCL